MKTTSILKIAALALPLVFTACKSHKKVAEPVVMTQEMKDKSDFINSVRGNAQTLKFLTSKVKFSVEVGQQKVTLTGDLKMKRDDVIRLQLMAFGFGLNFQVIQALFWNELFRPNQTTLVKTNDKLIVDSIANYTLLESGDDMIIGLEEGKMEYSWLASRTGSIIRMANILYKDRFHGNTQLNWDYDEFTALNKKAFPQKSAITLTTPEKEVKLGMTLKYIKQETEWEPRTEISNKYREVTVDEILRRFMSL